MTKISKRNMLTGKINVMELPITQEDLEKWESGTELIQNVFPNLTAEQREFLMTGMLPEEQSKIFGKLINKDFFELEVLIEEWAEEKGILSKATPMTQAFKTLEETTELCAAINSNNKDEIIDAIGDIAVTLIIQCKMQQVTLEECLNSAYNVIKDRKGTMIDGQFVKDE